MSFLAWKEKEPKNIYRRDLMDELVVHPSILDLILGGALNAPPPTDTGLNVVKLGLKNLMYR